jgi:hypothetical protein
MAGTHVKVAEAEGTYSDLDGGAVFAGQRPVTLDRASGCAGQKINPEATEFQIFFWRVGTNYQKFTLFPVETRFRLTRPPNGSRSGLFRMSRISFQNNSGLNPVEHRVPKMGD